MIEHAVKYHPDTIVMTILHKCLQVIIVTKSRIQFPVIRSLITMAHRLKQWTYIDGIKSHLFYMTDPVIKFTQPVLHRRVIIHLRCTKHAQRIYMIKYRFLVPHLFILLCHSLCLFR